MEPSGVSFPPSHPLSASAAPLRRGIDRSPSRPARRPAATTTPAPRPGQRGAAVRAPATPGPRARAAAGPLPPRRHRAGHRRERPSRTAARSSRAPSWPRCRRHLPRLGHRLRRHAGHAGDPPPDVDRRRRLDGDRGRVPRRRCPMASGTPARCRPASSTTVTAGSCTSSGRSAANSRAGTSGGPRRPRPAALDAERTSRSSGAAPAGAWDAGGARLPGGDPDRDRLRDALLRASSRRTRPAASIGEATSEDGIAWTKDAGPVVEPGLCGDFDARADPPAAGHRDGRQHRAWPTRATPSRRLAGERRLRRQPRRGRHLGLRVALARRSTPAGLPTASCTRSRRSSAATAWPSWSSGCRTTAPTSGSRTSGSPRHDGHRALAAHPIEGRQLAGGRPSINLSQEHRRHPPRGAAAVRDGVLLGRPYSPNVRPPGRSRAGSNSGS